MTDEPNGPARTATGGAGRPSRGGVRTWWHSTSMAARRRWLARGSCIGAWPSLSRSVPRPRRHPPGGGL